MTDGRGLTTEEHRYYPKTKKGYFRLINAIMLTSSQSFKLYGIVQRYFNKEEDAQAFVNEIEIAIDRKYEAEKDRLVTKDDLLKLPMELRVEMREQKAELLKWVFIFWVGQIGALLAIVLIFIKK